VCVSQENSGRKHGLCYQLLSSFMSLRIIITAVLRAKLEIWYFAMYTDKIGRCWCTCPLPLRAFLCLFESAEVYRTSRNCNFVDLILLWLESEYPSYCVLTSKYTCKYTPASKLLYFYSLFGYLDLTTFNFKNFKWIYFYDFKWRNSVHFNYTRELTC